MVKYLEYNNHGGTKLENVGILIIERLVEKKTNSTFFLLFFTIFTIFKVFTVLARVFGVN